MAGNPKAQEIYRHFKGNLYQILSLAEHTETEEILVIYQALYGDFKVYARPLSMFCSKVDREKYPEAVQEYRFELVEAWCAKSGLTVREETVAEPKKEEIQVPLENIEEEKVIPCQESFWVDEAEQEEPQEESDLDPMLLEFLDAETYTQKLNILAALHHRITDDMLTTMAIASDVEVEEGELEVRYQSLKNCLLTLEKYEISRN